MTRNRGIRGTCRYCGVKLDNPLGMSCPECKAKLYKANRKRSNSKRTSEQYRRYNIKSKYGLDYDPVTPDSTCEVCGTKVNLNIDHNHKTDEYRGILCRRCNTLVGRLEKGQDILQGCLNYIRRHGGTQ